MSIVHEIATVTAKGQITLPRTIRRALGADVGARVAFELHDDGRIVVSRADAEHEDPAIGAFLDLLAGDIRAGRHVRCRVGGHGEVRIIGMCVGGIVLFRERTCEKVVGAIGD